MNAKYTTAEYVAAEVMHTMKVLTITLLAYAVTVIQPVESGQLPMGKCIVHLIRIFIYCYKHLVNSALFLLFVFLIVNVDFAQPRYAIAENNNLTIEVRTNLEQFPLELGFKFTLTVRVKEDLRCTRKIFAMQTE